MSSSGKVVVANQKYIPAFDPWMCPTCDEIDDVPARIKENEAVLAHNEAVIKRAPDDVKLGHLLGDLEFKTRRVVAYAFTYQCPTCASVATTFKCHNCGEVIALREPADPNWFAYNPKLLPGGVWVDEDLKSKVDKINREAESKYPEINDARRKLFVRRKMLGLLAEEEEYHKEEVEAGRMTETQAQGHLKTIRLFLKRRATLD